MKGIERLSSILAVLACLLFVLTLPPTRVSPLMFVVQEQGLVPEPAGRLSVQVTQLPSEAPAACLAQPGAEINASTCTGAPLPGAKVSIFWEQRRWYFPAGVADANEHGKATLITLPRGRLWVLVEAAGFARRSRAIDLAVAPLDLVIALEPARELSVNVVDEQQRPIVGATVLVSGQDPLPFGALTDNAGKATLSRLGSPAWQVVAAARGYERVSQSNISNNLTVTLRKLGALVVTVRSATQQSVEGAQVFVGGALSPPNQGTTGAGGELRISGLEAGSYDLRAVHEGFVSRTAVGLQLQRGEIKQVVLQLEQGRFVTVQVTDGDQEGAVPIAGADVVLVEEGVAPFPLQGRTSKSGEVTLGPIAIGPASVGAHAEGFIGRGAVFVPDTLEGSFKITLRRGATVRGEVVGTNGHAIDGASIEVIGTDLDGLPIAETPWFAAVRRGHFEAMLAPAKPLIAAGELGVMPGPIPGIPLVSEIGSNSPAAVNFEPLALTSAWQSAVGGGFSLFPVTPGRVRLLVRHPSYVEAMSETITLEPGGEAAVKIVMLEGASLKGRVLDDRGMPVAQARIELSAVRGVSRHSLFTATDGSFEFEAVPTSVVLSLARPSSPFEFVLRKTLELGNAERQEIDITLPPEREEVTVEVSADRTAVDLATVVFTSLDIEVPLKKTLFTDPQGQVHLPDATGLPLRLQIEAPGFADYSQTFSLTPARIEVELERGVLVTGTVTAVRGRQALEGATVTLLANGERQITRTDSLGQFQLRDINPGEVTLLVTHSEYASHEQKLTIRSTGRADRALELDAIDLLEAGTVQGTVVDEHDIPVVGARVAVGVVPTFLPAGELPAGIAKTNERGEFKLTNLGAGTLTLEAQAVGKGRGKATVIVSAGEVTAEVRIALGAVDSEVETPQSGGVALTLREEASVVLIAQVSANSEAERAGLQVGDRVIAVDGAPIATASEAMDRLSGTPGTDVLLELQRGESTMKLRVNREQLRR